MLPKDLEKLLMKKKDSGNEEGMSENKIQAKLEVLKELIEAAQAEMGHRFKNGMEEMQKVSVMAPDKESLQEGLEKAQEVVESPMMEKMEEMSGQDMDKDKEEGEPEEHKAEASPEEEEEPKKEPKKRRLFSMEDDEDEE